MPMWFYSENTGFAPYAIGNATQTSGATIAFTVSVAVAVGALVIIGVQEAGNTVNGTVADSAGNTYTLAASQKCNNISGPVQLFYSVITTALTTSSTVTYTKNAAFNACIAGMATIGNAASSPQDGVVTATAFGNNTTPPSVTSGTPSQSGELIVGYTGNLAGKSYTEDSGNGFAIPFLSQTSGTTLGNIGGWLINTGTSAVTFAPTISANANWGSVIVGFKST